MPRWEPRKRRRGFLKEERPEPLVKAERVAIIVPFRDAHVEQKRSAHLRKFLPHMVRTHRERRPYHHHHPLTPQLRAGRLPRRLRPGVSGRSPARFFPPS